MQSRWFSRPGAYEEKYIVARDPENKLSVNDFVVSEKLCNSIMPYTGSISNCLGSSWIILLKKVKMQIYNLISRISSDFYIFTPWSLDLFIRVPYQLHGEHTVLQPFRRIELNIHIAISVLPGTHYFHLSQAKHVRVECLAQGYKIETMSQYSERRNRDISLKILHQAGIRNRTTGSDIDKAPRSNHCATSLSEKRPPPILTGLSQFKPCQVHG